MKKIYLTSLLLMVSVLTFVEPNSIQQAEAVNTYNLTYELFGGANHANNPTSYTDTQANFNLLPASKAGVAFQGWYKSEGFREVDRVNALPGNHVGVTKLYAKWGFLNYTVDFVSNGGTSVSQQTSIPTLSAGQAPVFVGTSGASSGYTSISRDINGDGKGDFINFVNGDRHIFLSHPTLGFTYTTVTNNLINFAWASKFYDINNDGLEDLIVLADNTAMTYSLRQPDGSLGAETLFTMTAGGVNYYNSIAFDLDDIDGDGDLDLAVAALNIAIYRLNEGNFTFGQAVLIQNFGGYGRGVEMHDLTGDGYLDIVVTTDTNSFVKWGNGVTPFGGNLSYLSIGPYRPFISDINRDGNYDIVGLENNRKVPLYVPVNSGLSVNFFSTLPGAANALIGWVSWVGDEMDVNGDGSGDLFYMQGQYDSGMIMSRDTGTYYTQNFQLQDSTNSGTVVYDPAYGTFGIMGVGFNNALTRYHSFNATHSVSHLASIQPTREGYTFAGWYEDSSFSGSPFNFNASVSANKTLYAKWELVNYGVNYVMNGGTNNPNNPTSVNVESVSVNLQEPTKPGSRFLGWYSDSSFTTPISAVPGNRTSSISIYAKWLDPITVTFNVGGGSAIPSVSNLPGEVLTQPADPTRNGYTFAGWFTNSSFSTPYTFTTIPNQNTTIFAKWTALNFSITFNTNGGSAVDSLSFNTDQNLNLPAAPTKVGHTFAGWFTDEALTQRFTSTKMPPNNVILYAKWNVNVHQLDWTIEDQQFDMDVAYGSSLTSILPTPTKYQFDFLGWSIDGETVIDLNTFTMPDEDVSLIAIFKDNLPPVVFTLTDGDTYAGGVDIIFNEGTALLDGQPVESGYRVSLPGTYSLIITDAAGNEVSITFTVIEETDTSIRWVIFAAILISTWFILAILYFLTRDKKPRGPGGTKPKRAKDLPVDKPVIKEKPKSEKPVKKIEQETPKPTPAPIPEKKVSVPKVAKPKVDLSKVVTKPIELDPQIDQGLVTNEIFKAPLKIRKDPIENYDAPLKEEFNQTFVADNRLVKVPELVYVPQTTNEAFYRNLFRYIHRFAKVLSAQLLSNLTQTVVKLTSDEEAKLKIIEASTRTAEALSQQPPVEYLLKILRRNVALNRDVLNPRDKYVYSYQRLATLLEELGIYVEAVVVAREAYERGLIDTPEATFEKRLTRLEKKLIDSDGKRQDMLRK